MPVNFRLAGIWSLVAAVFLMMIVPAQAQRRGGDQWVKLGEQEIGFGVDRETIQLGREAGRFRAIKLIARRNDVFVVDVRATFRSGETQDLAVRQYLPAGRETGLLQLAPSPRGDNGRVIERLDMVYKRRPGFGGAAVVEVWGVVATEGGPGYSGGDGRGDRDRGYGGPPPQRIYGGDIPRGWVLFGTQNVGFEVERDTVRIGREGGRFGKIALRALRNDILLREIVVNYVRGDSERINLNMEITANGVTPPITMKREGRIQDIQLVYQARPGFRGQAVVEVYGEYSDNWQAGPGAGGPPPSQWLLLGAQRAEMLSNDRHVFEVGRRLGAFRSIKIRALKHAVEIRSLRITFANGETEDVRVPRELSGGQESAPIELRGRERFIERIELNYRTKLNFKGDAVVEVYGQK